MRVGQAFGSFIKAETLRGPLTLTIANVTQQKFDDDLHWVLSFATGERLTLNKTNAEIISAIHGDEMDDWNGKAITLAKDKTQFKGKTVDCVRVMLAAPNQLNLDGASSAKAEAAQ